MKYHAKDLIKNKEIYIVCDVTPTHYNLLPLNGGVTHQVEINLVDTTYTLFRRSS